MCEEAEERVNTVWVGVLCVFSAQLPPSPPLSLFALGVLNELACDQCCIMYEAQTVRQRTTLKAARGQCVHKQVASSCFRPVFCLLQSDRRRAGQGSSHFSGGPIQIGSFDLNADPQRERGEAHTFRDIAPLHLTGNAPCPTLPYPSPSAGRHQKII